MSWKTRTTRVKHEVEESITCDACQKTFLTNCHKSGPWDPFEIQEMLRWKTRGGYGSVFGDGEEISLDLCQHCVKKYLGEFIQNHGNAYWPQIEESK